MDYELVMGRAATHLKFTNGADVRVWEGNRTPAPENRVYEYYVAVDFGPLGLAPGPESGRTLCDVQLVITRGRPGGAAPECFERDPWATLAAIVQLATGQAVAWEAYQAGTKANAAPRRRSTRKDGRK